MRFIPTAPAALVAVRVLVTVVVLEVAFASAFAYRFELPLRPEQVDSLGMLLVPVVLIEAIALRLAGTHRHSWRYTNLRDVVELATAITGATTILLALRYLPITPQWLRIPLGVILANWVAATAGLTTTRVLRRLQSERAERMRGARGEQGPTPVLLIGAGRAGVMVAEELRKRPDIGLVPVGFVDDDPAKQDQRVVGVDVLGTTDDLADIARMHGVEEAVITMASVSRSDVQRIILLCQDAGLDTQIIPGLYEIVGGRFDLSRIRPVDVEDLLGRDPVELDATSLQGLLNSRVVLVTGAGGSIGSELARQAARFGPSRLVLVERAEPALWAVDRELKQAYPHMDIRACIGDVCDRARMRLLFEGHRPDVVVHAAAHKHVPLMEGDPGEAVKNNLGGTKTVADVAAGSGVRNFVLVSTDKAVNPTSVMGATKRLSERYVQHIAEQSSLRFVAVRFGNVLGSTGSVVPIFQQQVKEGGPVTVTHPDMVRYFMTIPEAAGLVLQAAAIGKPGEILVLDMGEPVRIADLAENIIRLSGFEPGRDIRIEYTGLRPGEKLFEELSKESENAERTRHPKVWIGRDPAPRWDDVEGDVDKLLVLSDVGDGIQVRKALQDLVPEYRPPQRDGHDLDDAPDDDPDPKPDPTDGPGAANGSDVASSSDADSLVR